MMSTFISYSRADSGFAVRLAKDLKSAGYDVWLDQLDIPTGARWDDEVEAALEACTTFMIILSAESIQSQNVKDEIAYAVDAGKDILPVRIKSGNIPLRLRRLQYVDFTDKPYEKSLKEIKSLLSTTGQLLTANEAEKKLSAAEAQPAAEKAPPPRPVPIPGARQPQVREPEVTGPPVAKKPWSRGLVMGMVAVAALVVAGVIINAIGTREPPVVTPPTGALVTENPPTEQPTAKPTLDTTQVAALTQTGQSEAITTKFLKSSDLADWEDFILGLGSRGQVSVSTSDGGLVFNLDDRDLHAYYIYKPVIYEDVAIRMKVENLGQNTNKVSMVCRRSSNTWYEFTITGASLWQLFDHRGDEYAQLDNGGSLAGKAGKTTNAYEMRCIGNEISLYVNGVLENTFAIQRNVYPRGQVGLGVSTGDVFPIDIRVIEFEVSESRSGPASVSSTVTSEVAGNASTPAPGAGSPVPSGSEEILVSPKDGMVMIFVPEGEFTMGSDVARRTKNLSIPFFWTPFGSTGQK